MELIRIALCAPCHPGEGSLHLAHADGPPCDIAPSTRGNPDGVDPDSLAVRDISHPEPDAGWERRTFQLPRSDMFGSSDSAYPESFSLSIQCRSVLLKLPNISD